MPSELPIWDPATAASAGAGFAGILGAIVVAITFQIVLLDTPGRQSRTDKQEPHLSSVVVATFTILLLLAAAYLYVVLSGTTATTSRVINACQQAMLKSNPPDDLAIFATDCEHGFSFIKAAAAMFAIGGSYLGLGAICVAFTLSAIVEEKFGSDEDGPRMAAFWFYVSGIVLALFALVWGYREALWVLRNDRLSVGAYLLSALPYSIAGVAVGIATVWWTRSRLIAKSRPSAVTKHAAVIVVGVYVTGPFIWYLLVEATGSNKQPFGGGVVAQFMLGWVLACVTFLSCWHPYFHRRTANEDTASQGLPSNIAANSGNAAVSAASKCDSPLSVEGQD